MKRVGYITDKDGRRITLLEAMGDYGNVQKAYNKARKCKRHRKDVLIFTKDKEENLDKVREDIINLAYEPSKYHYFKVYEPKERQIMALPFYDRVVQHAINNVLEPIFDKRFISQSYACRKGNGIDFVGYKHRATHRKVRKDSIKRIKRTIKKCESGKITKEQLQKSIQSWTGHAGHADSYNLRKKIETLAEAAIEKAA